MVVLGGKEHGLCRKCLVENYRLDGAKYPELEAMFHEQGGLLGAVASRFPLDNYQAGILERVLHEKVSTC